MGIFKRKIKNAFDIARDIGVDEKKVRELRDGDRHIEGVTMDKVLSAINRSDADRAIEKIEIFEWYKNTDLKKLRKDFGYNTQAYLSRVTSVDNGELNRFENKKFAKINPTIIKMYDFYHNDFNKNINKEENKVKDKDSVIEYTDKNKNKMFKWYLKTNLKKLRGEMAQNEMAKLIGIPQSCYCDLENKLHVKRLSKNMIKVYEYFNNKDDNNTITLNTENMNVSSEPMKEINITRIPINFAIGEPVEELKNHKLETREKEPQLETCEEEPQEKYLEEEKVITSMKPNFLQEKEDTCPLQEEYDKLKEENRALKRQIMLYEKLIEMIP